MLVAPALSTVLCSSRWGLIVFVVNGVVVLFIERYTRDYEKRTGITR